MRTLGELCDDDDEGSSAFCLEGCSLTDLAALIKSALAISLQFASELVALGGKDMAFVCVDRRHVLHSSEALRRLWASPLTPHLLASLSASQSWVGGGPRCARTLPLSPLTRSLAHSLTRSRSQSSFEAAGFGERA